MHRRGYPVLLVVVLLGLVLAVGFIVQPARGQTPVVVVLPASQTVTLRPGTVVLHQFVTEDGAHCLLPLTVASRAPEVVCPRPPAMVGPIIAAP